MGTAIKPGFDPQLAREVLAEQKQAQEALQSQEMALARRYQRSRLYNEDRMVVYSLYLQGFDAKEIPEQATAATGRKFTLAKVDALIRSAINDQKKFTTEERRAIENARMDMYLVALQPRIKMGDDKAIGRAVEISKRRAALNGLDAPVRVQAHVTTDVDPSLLAMAEQARMDAAEAIQARFPRGIVDAEVVPSDTDYDGQPTEQDYEDSGYVDTDFAPDVPEEEL